MTRVVTLDPVTGAARLSVALEDTADLMKQWGAQLVRESQRAFREQKFGEIAWPARYPGQDEPFVNFAAIVMHANRGVQPKARHFRRLPALIGEGGLRASISSRVVAKDTVEAGSNKDYSGLHQSGGLSTQAITGTAKDTLRKFLKKKSSAPYRRKMRFLLFTDSLTTDVNARPFIGITPRGEDYLRKSLEDFVVKRSKPPEAA